MARRKIEDIKGRKELVRTEKKQVEAFLGYLESILVVRRPGLTKIQIIAFAALARAVGAVEAGLAVLDSGNEREVASSVRILLEHVHRFAWLVEDPAQQEKRVELYHYNVMREEWRAFDALVKHANLASMAGVDAAKITNRRDELEKDLAASESKLKAAYTDLKKCRLPKLDEMFDEVKSLDMYKNAYRHLSVQEHSEGLHLRRYISVSAGGHAFHLARKDELVVSNLFALHLYLTLLAQKVGEVCTPPLDARYNDEINKQSKDLHAYSDVVLRTPNAAPPEFT